MKVIDTANSIAASANLFDLVAATIGRVVPLDARSVTAAS
jgi:hypothetical protein